jgi:hypothetical protein
MPDKRSTFEKHLDGLIGPPLYYCSECLRAIKVTPIEGSEPTIERPCTEEDGCLNAQIFAPRKAIASGEGGLNFQDKVKLTYWQLAATLTGRCV